MRDVESRSRRGFVLRWVILCGMGLGGGLAAGLALSVPIETVVGMMLVTPVVFAIAGSLLGAVQWLAMWRTVRTGVRWIGASAIGLAVGMTIGVILVEVLGRALTGEQVRLLSVGLPGRVLGLALVGTVAGLAVGGTQRLAVRARATGEARWILGCVVGFGAGLPAGGLAAELVSGGLGSVGGFATFLGVAGVLVGAFTARGASRIAAPCGPSST